MMWKSKHVLCSEAPGDEGGGGGDQLSGHEGSTLLDTGAAGTGAGDWLPEKFRVNGDDGQLNIEQSARKMADSYSHLAKRMGSGDAPPKTAEEYAPVVETEGFNWDDFRADPRAQSFMKAAHAKGITNDQMSFILGEYSQQAPDLINGAAALDADAARAELQQTWKTDAEFNQNVGLAYRAFNALADEADRGRINEIGNNPIVLRLLAKMGAEMREDVAPAGEVSGEELQGVRDLMKSEAYTNDRHPDHEKVSAQVSAFYRKHYGDNPVG